MRAPRPPGPRRRRCAGRWRRSSATLDGGPPEPAAQAAPRVDRPAPRAPAARRQAPLGTVTIAATGDIVMGSTPRLPPAAGAHFFDAVESALAGTGRPRQPRGDALERRFQQVRPGEHELLRIPDPALVRRAAERGRVHGSQPGEQPRVRLRPVGLEETVAALDRRAPAHGAPGRDRATSGWGRSVSPSSASRPTPGRRT